MPTLGVIAAIFHEEERILLTRRRDVPVWCLPGGHVDDGETPMQAVEREVAEETGLVVSIECLVGVYCKPNWRHGGLVELLFLCQRQGGELQLTAETTGIDYFPVDALPAELLPSVAQQVADARTAGPQAVLRTDLIAWPLRVADYPPLAQRLAQLGIQSEYLTDDVLTLIRKHQFD
ncbi:MAG TPA: NUDIX domain-containing protein [Anaerolineae bacterium]|nr:NUDIX domain-containing protein [Anaerolineae bacterium]HIQ06675.1 NUDIX domain-containing protein [Anaerolineae bacterium]